MRDVPGHRRGNKLSPEQQRWALSLYCHRFTKDHIPAWSKTAMEDGRPYRVQFASDQDWLANTWFPVNKDGTISKRKGAEHCYSMPTWPEGMTVPGTGPKSEAGAENEV